MNFIMILHVHNQNVICIPHKNRRYVFEGTACLTIVIICQIYQDKIGVMVQMVWQEL